MPKISIANLGSAQVLEEVADKAETADEGVKTKALFSGAAPIHTRLHALRANQRVSWKDSPAGHVVYVWSGEVESEGRPLAAGSMLLVEHGASGSVRALIDDSAVMVFNCPDTHSDRPMRPGGRVHLLPANRVPRADEMSDDGSRIGGALYADSDCETCELWLHETSFEEGYAVPLHKHSEDEVIVVVRGEIVLGKRSYGRGTGLAVAQDTVYGFTAGRSGLKFINFRPKHPTVTLGDDGVTLDEQEIYTSKTGFVADRYFNI